MCLIAWSWLSHPRWRLVIAGNRDEFHRRPTASAHWWSDQDGVFGGRDLEAGGSWLAIGRNGRMAAVTNFREPGVARKARSRGDLVTEYLSSAIGIEDWAFNLSNRGDEWSGFNLVLFDLAAPTGGAPGEAARSLFVSNRTTRTPIPLEAGLHAVSNGTLNEPWPKLRRLRERLATALHQPHPESALFAALADPDPADESELPDTGLDREQERRLSSALIRGDEYGTRSSTVVLVGHDGEVEFAERSWSPDGATALRESRSRFVLLGPNR